MQYMIGVDADISIITTHLAFNSNLYNHAIHFQQCLKNIFKKVLTFRLIFFLNFSK